jgi:hypothetical protein
LVVYFNFALKPLDVFIKPSALGPSRYFLKDHPANDDDLQVWFWEFKCDITSSQLLVNGCECVHLKDNAKRKEISCLFIGD